MSRFWRGWFLVWCLSIGVFGAVLAGGALQATSAPVATILATLRGLDNVTFDPMLRFSLAVMGAVSMGWAVTLLMVVRAAIELRDRGRPFWNAISAGMITWFVIDSLLSVVTGFALNVAPNIALAGMYAVGLFGSGALRRPVGLADSARPIRG